MVEILHTDSELVSLLRARDKRSFDLIYKRSWLRLFRLAQRITEDSACAEDITQDAFVSLWERGCFQQIHSIDGYLYQTVKFRCFMHLRSGRISKKHLEHFARIIQEQVSPIEEYSLKEMEETLEACVATLPEKCREVYRLSRIENLPNKQIAEKLRISPKTVENQITKALRQLRLSIDKLTIMAFLLHL